MFFFCGLIKKFFGLDICPLQGLEKAPSCIQTYTLLYISQPTARADLNYRTHTPLTSVGRDDLDYYARKEQDLECVYVSYNWIKPNCDWACQEKQTAPWGITLGGRQQLLDGRRPAQSHIQTLHQTLRLPAQINTLLSCMFSSICQPKKKQNVVLKMYCI